MAKLYNQPFVLDQAYLDLCKQLGAAWEQDIIAKRTPLGVHTRMGGDSPRINKIGHLTSGDIVCTKGGSGPYHFLYVSLGIDGSISICCQSQLGYVGWLGCENDMYRIVTSVNDLTPEQQSNYDTIMAFNDGFNGQFDRVL